MDRVRTTPAWRAMERATLERTFLREFATQDSVHAYMCGRARAGERQARSLIRDISMHRNVRKTQTVRAWGARYSSRVSAPDGHTLNAECEVVKDGERTVGIEVHDVVLQRRNVMVWNRGGLLEVNADCSIFRRAVSLQSVDTSSVAQSHRLCFCWWRAW
jgi:hypothetical protein